MLYYMPTPIIASLYCLRGCADTSRGSRPPIPASLLIIHVCRLAPRLFGRLILQTLHGDYASVNIILHHLLFPFFDLVLVYNRSPVSWEGEAFITNISLSSPDLRLHSIIFPSLPPRIIIIIITSISSNLIISLLSIIIDQVTNHHHLFFVRVSEQIASHHVTHEWGSSKITRWILRPRRFPSARTPLRVFSSGRLGSVIALCGWAACNWLLEHRHPSIDIVECYCKVLTTMNGMQGQGIVIVKKDIGRWAARWFLLRCFRETLLKSLPTYDRGYDMKTTFRRVMSHQCRIQRGSGWLSRIWLLNGTNSIKPFKNMRV